VALLASEHRLVCHRYWTTALGMKMDTPSNSYKYMLTYLTARVTFRTYEPSNSLHDLSIVLGDIYSISTSLRPSRLVFVAHEYQNSIPPRSLASIANA